MFRGAIERVRDMIRLPLKRKSYALNKLDIKLHSYLQQRGGYFVEAGGNDGVSQSNTLYFEKYLGWRGLLIEAIPALAEKCRRNRSRCATENCALVSRDYPDRIIEMHYRNLMSVVKGGLSDAAAEARHLALGEGGMLPDDKPYTISVPAKTLSCVLDEHRVGRIDLLSLDVEGYEVEVLKGVDFNRHRPEHLLVEVHDIRAVEKLVLPWYRRVDVLLQNEEYADILYEWTKK